MALQGEPVPPIPTYESKQPTPVAISGIPDGYAGTRAVLEVMADLVNGSYSDEYVNRLARQITKNVPARDALGEAMALLSWMHTNLRYTRLPAFPGMLQSPGLQRLQTPLETLRDGPGTGECASLSVALAAMLKSLGNEVGFRVAGTDSSQPINFEHVYLVLRTPTGVVPIDPSYDLPVGAEHPAVATSEDYWIPS